MTMQDIAVKAGRLLGTGVAGLLVAKQATERNITRARSRWSVVAIPTQQNAPIIGNLRTRIYHESSDAHLPDEERRVYFESAQEAEAQGYRPAGHPTES